MFPTEFATSRGYVELHSLESATNKITNYVVKLPNFYSIRKEDYCWLIFHTNLRGSLDINTISPAPRGQNENSNYQSKICANCRTGIGIST